MGTPGSGGYAMVGVANSARPLSARAQRGYSQEYIANTADRGVTAMVKTTTHRNPISREARIERRAKKRDETVLRKKLVKSRKNDATAQDDKLI